MRSWIQLGLIGVALGFASWGCFGLTHHLIVAIDKWGESAPGPTQSSLGSAVLSIQQTSDTANKTLAAATATISQVQPVLRHLDLTITGLSRECVPGPCGLLTDTAKTLNTVRGTFGQIEVAANHENRNLGELDIQEMELFADAHRVLGGAAGVEDNVNNLLKDEALHRTLNATADTSENVAGVTKSLNLMTSHLEKEVDSPKPLWKTLIPMSETAAKFYACAFHRICVE